MNEKHWDRQDWNMPGWGTGAKSEWGDGDWQNEHDKYEWRDDETGLPCLIVRNGSGALCGYVGVPEGHPAFEKGYDDVKQADGDYIDVHGGLTFAGHCSPDHGSEIRICHTPEPGEPDNVWWLGFDCGHSMDQCPAMDAHPALKGMNRHDRDDRYRNVAYVKKEIRQLAQQLKDLTPQLAVEGEHDQ